MRNEELIQRARDYAADPKGWIGSIDREMLALLAAALEAAENERDVLRIALGKLSDWVGRERAATQAPPGGQQAGVMRKLPLSVLDEILRVVSIDDAMWTYEEFERVERERDEWRTRALVAEKALNSMAKDAERLCERTRQVIPGLAIRQKSRHLAEQIEGYVEAVERHVLDAERALEEKP